METFEVLGVPELRAVLRTVLEQLQGADAADGEGSDSDDGAGDGRPTSLEVRRFWSVEPNAP